MSLNINDLGGVLKELWGTRAKAYNIGLMLKVPNGSLECIKKLTDPSDQLRDMLQAWLQMTARQNWKTIVEALQSLVIGEPALAAVIEIKYCQGKPVELDTKVPQEPIPIMLDKQRLHGRPASAKSTTTDDTHEAEMAGLSWSTRGNVHGICSHTWSHSLF